MTPRVKWTPTRSAPGRGIDQSLWNKARLKALNEGRYIRDVIEDLLRKWLEE